MNFVNKIKDLASEATGKANSSNANRENWYITVEGAEGVRDDDWFSKADSYVKVEFGGKNFETRSIKNDRSPNWNETFHFQLSPHDVEKGVRITLIDKDWGLDDHLGTATISRGDLPTFSGDEKILSVPIYRKDEVNGIVRLRVKQINEGQQPLASTNQYQSNMSSSYYPQQQQMPQYNVVQQQQPFSQPQGVQGGTGPQMNQPYSQPIPQNQQNVDSNSNYYGQKKY